MDSQDLISAFTALFIFGMIWLRTRMHYAKQARGPKRLCRAGLIYFAAVSAVLVLGWLLAPLLGHALWPQTSAPSAIMRFFWFMATYLVFIVIHRVLKSRGIEVFKAAG
jgi:hypothetical protein